jgi:DNA (cytosine-5)-methyltransferase 1
VKAFIGFAGFGGVDIALRQAGFETIGIEIDDVIAEVNRINGGNCLTADILDINPEDYIGYELAHFSPPCPSFSAAKTNGVETELDINLAHWIARFIVVVQPQYFTLENVWGYRKSHSWSIIFEALTEMGYGVNWWHLNAADYSVPQTRKRMIVIARYDGRKPQKPWPTHSKKGDMFTLPWNSWFSAIEDLIPDLPDSQFAPWQLDRMPDELKSFLMMTGNTNRKDSNISGRGILDIDQPANTVTTYGNGSLPRAFLLGQGERSKPKNGLLPADTITGNSNQTGIKAYLMPVNGEGSTGFGKNRPAMTITSGHICSKYRAFVINSGNTTSRDFVTTCHKNEPVFTVTTMAKMAPLKVYCQGRVISMSPRALARFQGFPDWFVLPDNRGLACRGVGNALPPPVMVAVIKSLSI